MRILIHDRHTPHADNLISKFPEFKWFTAGWNGDLRPLPDGVQKVDFTAVQHSEFDVVIEDEGSLPYGSVKCKRKIFIQHCEHDEGNQENAIRIRRALDWCDKMVVVSDHKRATMRTLGIGSKVQTIELDFDVSQWPTDRYTVPDLIGTWHIAMNLEQTEFFRAVSGGFKHVVIGKENEGKGFNVVAPNSFSEMKREASKLSVFVHLVVGQAFGYSTMEAMAMGIPVVLGSVPEAWNFCFDSWNCFISRDQPMNSINWMRDRIRWLLDNPKEAEAMGAAGRASITDYFRRLNTKDKWLNVFK